MLNSGYDIIERNWRNRFGEIDIIAKDGDTLVFVEVKQKSDNRYGSPGEMITKNKIHKLKNTALAYVKETNFEGSWQIDAVLIDHELNHIKNITL